MSAFDIFKKKQKQNALPLNEVKQKVEKNRQKAAICLQDAPAAILFEYLRQIEPNLQHDTPYYKYVTQRQALFINNVVPIFSSAYNEFINAIDDEAITKKVNEEFMMFIADMGVDEFFKENVIINTLINPNDFWVIIPLPVSENETYNRNSFIMEIIPFQLVIDYSNEYLAYMHPNGYNVFLSKDYCCAYKQSGETLELATSKDDSGQMIPIYEFIPQKQFTKNFWVQLPGKKAQIENYNLSNIYLHRKYDYLQSYWFGAYEQGMRALLAKNYFDYICHNHSEPLTFSQTTICSTCNGQKIKADGTKCPNCEGKGYIPYKMSKGQSSYEIPVPKYLANEKGIDIKDYIHTNYPDGDFYKAIEETADKEHKATCDALEIFNIAQAESGYAKEMNKKSQENIFNTIGYNLFKTLEKVYQVIYEIRYKDSDAKDKDYPYFKIPDDITKQTSSQILQEIQDARSKGIADTVLYSLYEKYISVSYNHDPVKKKAQLWLLHNDPYYMVSDKTKNLRADIEVMKKTINLPLAMNRLVGSLSQEDFLQMKDEEIEKNISQILVKMIPTV